jgi:uncharacterized protein YoaH (UPF0181 family)
MKINQLNLQGAQELAKMQEGFQKDDFDLVTKAYDAFQKYATEKNNTLMKLQDTAQKHQEWVTEFDQKLKEFNQKVAQDNFKNSLDNKTFNFNQKKEAFDEYIRNSDLTEKQKNDALETWYKQQDIEIKKAQLNLDVMKEQFSEGSLTPQNYSKNVADIPGVKSYDKLGINYFDPTQFSDKKQASTAERVARAAGIPILSDSKDRESVSAIDTALSNLDALQVLFNQLAASGFTGKQIQKVAGVAGEIFGTEKGDILRAYQSNRDFLFQQISTLAGSHPRLNAQELVTAANALPKLDFFNSDTLRQGANKLNQTRQYLNNSLNGIIPERTYNSIPAYVQANPILGAQKIKELQSAGLSPEEALQIINGNPKGFDKPLSMGQNYSASEIASAIKQVESGGNYQAKGASGEFGAYQFMPSSWGAWASKYLGDRNAPMTKDNQDKVAIKKVQDLLDQGYSPREVALVWNGGQPIQKSGINKFGVKYNSGAYADKVLNMLG